MDLFQQMIQPITKVSSEASFIQSSQPPIIGNISDRR